MGVVSKYGNLYDVKKNIIATLLSLLLISKVFCRRAMCFL